jgi:hypothetical protein
MGGDLAVAVALALTWICPSCGSAAATRYCGSCGEESLVAVVPSTGDKAANQPARSFVGRLRASLRALASPPGRLTADWIRGRRVGYLAPLSLFLWINVAFFLVQSASGLGILTWPLQIHLSDDSIAWFTTRLFAQHRPDHAAAGEAYADVFNALEAVHAKSLVIVMVPAFALALRALLLDRGGPFKVSLTFATHFLAFALIWLCALFPTVAFVLRVIVATGLPMPSHHSLDLAVTSLEAAVLGWYLYGALGKVFAMSRPRRLLMAITLLAALLLILKAYHVVVFAATLYST